MGSVLGWELRKRLFWGKIKIQSLTTTVTVVLAVVVTAGIASRRRPGAAQAEPPEVRS